MIDLVNGLILLLCGIAIGAIITWKRKRLHVIILVIGSVLGAAIHSLWRHALERNEQDDWNKIIRNMEEDIIDIGTRLSNMGGADPTIFKSLGKLHAKMIDVRAEMNRLNTTKK